LEKVGSSIRPETPHSPWILASIMFTRAQYQMVKQDYQSKYDLTRAMLAIDPNSIGAHAMLADFFAYTGDIEGALRAYRRATDSGGSLVGVYLARAGYLNAINRHEAAIALLQSSLPMVPPIYGKCQLLISQASSNNRVRSH
jgi:tetratricopeptide (TPR) repeat protein